MTGGGLEALAERIAGARRLTILTGAGVSAASGVPTFRGPNGLWRQHRPEDLATPQAFARDPELVWEWYAWRRSTIAACRPNPAHEVIAEWSRREGCRVVTQNVDDLHLRAGTQGLVRLHGSIWELTCWKGCPAGSRPWRDERLQLPQAPRCPHCGGFARPAVVWFGEALRPVDLQAAQAASSCDVFLTIGTSSVVYPAAGFVLEARQQGAFTAEINPEDTPASAILALAIRGTAEDILPSIKALMEKGL